MKANLLYSDKDFSETNKNNDSQKTLINDLGLNIIFSSMSKNDDFIRTTSQNVILNPLSDYQQISYRQAIIKDCIKYPDFARKLYEHVISTLKKFKKDSWLFYWKYESSYSDALSLLIMLVNSLIEIQALTLNEEYAFNSQGLLKFRKLLKSEFSPSYLLEIKEVLKKLKETKSTYIHAKIGDFLYGEEYKLLDEDSQKKNWFKWLFAPKFELADRDDSGLADLAKRVTLAYFPVSETIKNTAKKVLGFFETLHFEMAYYIGCLNLYETMQNINIEITFPDFSRENMFTDLKDIALTLYSDKEVIANSLAYDDANPIFITGPNQGGKSTFLRSVGQAYLLMQAGLFVTAKSFRAMPANSIFTHFKKEEDRDMENGKLAEELARMSNIINVIEPHSVILFNESFASTNEIEGSEIARQIIEALVEKDIRVVFVTHFYHLAKEFYKNSDYHALFLRAEILSDKQRTFKIVPGSPLPTSNGTDLYESVF